MHILPLNFTNVRKPRHAHTQSHSQQENIIREFNLNELYQKSKKLNKSKGDWSDKINESQFPPLHEEEEPEVDAQVEETETKKDK